MENDELNEMRSQMAALKAKLDKETIVNERLLRESMNTKAIIINRQAWISGVASLLVIFIVSSWWELLGISKVFCIVTVVYMAFAAFMTWWMHRDINKETMSGDLLTVAKKAKELKDNYNKWIKFAIPVTALWAVWFFYEVWRTNENKHVAIMLIICGAVGGLIGGVIGWRMHRKVVNTCDDIVRQIEE